MAIKQIVQLDTLSNPSNNDLFVVQNANTLVTANVAFSTIVSAGQVDLSGYTLLTTTAAISAGLNNDLLNNIVHKTGVETIVGDKVFSYIRSNLIAPGAFIQADSSGWFSDAVYIPASVTQVAAISAGLNTRVTQQTNSLNTLFNTYANSTTVAAISAGLNTRIAASDLLNTQQTASLNTLYSTYANSTTVAAISAGLNTKFVLISGSTMTGGLIVPSISSPRTGSARTEAYGSGSLGLTQGDGGYYNTAVGYNTLHDNYDGGNNVAIGQSALNKNTIGNSNTAVGSNVLTLSTVGDNNTAVGHQSLSQNVSGYGNTAFGYSSLYQVVNGYKNTAIGYMTDMPVGNGTYRTVLGAEASISDDNTIRCGRVSTDTLRGYNYTADSDRRLKENIVDLPLGLNFVMSLRPVSYKWKDRTIKEIKNEDGNIIKSEQHFTFSRNHCGFIAQEIGDALKATGMDFGFYQDSGVARGITEEVAVNVDDYKDPLDLKGYSVEQLLAIAVKAIQELKVSNDQLKSRVEELEAK